MSELPMTKSSFGLRVEAQRLQTVMLKNHEDRRLNRKKPRNKRCKTKTEIPCSTSNRNAILGKQSDTVWNSDDAATQPE